jgi:hypothetical protein
MPLSNPTSYNFNPVTSGTATPTSVASSTTSVSLLASNSNRKGATIWNNSTANLFVEFGATASATAFTFRLDPQGYVEIPFGYTGAISGIWSTANGTALVREFT